MSVNRTILILGKHSFCGHSCCALFAVLRPGDEMLAISGKPYDTLEEVIGSRKEDPNLVPFGLFILFNVLVQSGALGKAVWPDAMFDSPFDKSVAQIVEQARQGAQRIDERAARQRERGAAAAGTARTSLPHHQCLNDL